MAKIEDYEQEFLELDAVIKAKQKRQKEIVAEIKKLHTNSETANYGMIQVVVSKPYWTFELDIEELKRANRLLYNQYLKPKRVEGMLKVQVKKGK